MDMHVAVIDALDNLDPQKPMDLAPFQMHWLYQQKHDKLFKLALNSRFENVICSRFTSASDV